MKRHAISLALFALAALLGACQPDPVHEDAVKAQGPETPGIPTGPFHRAGQPCLVCHAERGPASMVMSFAGTIYQSYDNRTPLEGAVVHVFDSRGHEAVTGTNCVGNFFIQKKQFDPVWPVWVQIEYGTQAGQPAAQMLSPIFRDGSCADCHHDPHATNATGHIYYAPQGVNMSFPPGGCK